MILSDDELAALTQRSRRSAQIRVLVALGIPYRQRPDNSIVVFRRDIDEPALNMLSNPQSRMPARISPAAVQYDAAG